MKARRFLTLRRLLAALGAAGAAYVLVIAGYLVLVVRPQADALGNDTRQLIVAHEAASRHIELLDVAVMGGETLLRGRREGMRLAPDSAALFRARVDTLRAAHQVAIPGDVRIPTSVRQGLGRATAAEERVADHVDDALSHLEAGRLERAIASLVAADHERTLAEGELLSAQRAAMQEVLAREDALQAAIRRTVVVLAWWGVAGAGLVIVSFLLLRTRLYRPMAALESSLDGVMRGDLSTRVSLTPGDEMGRLGTLFDRMTDILEEREQAALDRQRGIIDRYRRILEESASGLVAIDPESMTVAQANQRVLDDLGVDEPSLVGRPVADLWHTERDVAGHVIRDVAAGGAQRGVFIAEQIAASGARVPVEVTVFASGEHEGTASHPRELIAVVHDLTERRRLDRVNERLARFALDIGADFRTDDPTESLGDVARLAVELLGVSRSSIWMLEEAGLRCVAESGMESGTEPVESDVGRVLSHVDHPRYIQALHEERTIAVPDLTADDRTRDLADLYLSDVGVCALLDVPIRVGGEVVAVLCNEHVGERREWLAEERVLAAAVADFVSQIVTLDQRRSAETELRASEERYRTVFERALVGIAEMDEDGGFIRANAHLQELLGYTEEELTALTWWDVTHAEHREADRRAAEAVRRGEVAGYRTEKRYIRKDGLPVWVEVHVGPVWRADGSLSHFISVSRDMTEARDLREQLAHAQRMDSVGRLAGGIAHDFNNLLTAVLGNVELARTRTEGDPQLDAELVEIEDAAQRATSLTRQLLTFARRQVVTPTIVELDGLADGAERLLRRLIGETIELTTDLDAEGAMVRIDPRQFDQVLMNLAVNARDAMPDGGRVRITSRVRPAVELPEVAVLENPAEEYVVLEVADTGLGMSPDVQSRVFEPFFSTKDPGEGTGLGLATCYGIIHQAEGSITVSSELGHGSVFRVVLPRVQRGVEPAASGPAKAPEAVAGRTVLVVEDADAVRRLVVEALRRVGYTVLESNDGEDALEVAAEWEGTIDVVVSDIVMPKMNGPKAVEALRTSRPQIRALFISGYAADTVRDSALVLPGTDFLAKPFSAGELVRKVGALSRDAVAGGLKPGV